MDAFSKLKTYNAFVEFAAINPERLYRIWVYKRVFTPLEQEKKYIDQGMFEDVHAHVGMLREVIPLGNGDYLLGFAFIYESVADLASENRSIEYFRLSEIRMSYLPKDDEAYADED